MEKHRKALGAILIQFVLFVNIGICQTYTELDITKLAAKTNQQIKGLKIDNGIKAKECISIGRTMIYQYEVPANWNAPPNLKETIIKNIRNLGAGQTYYQQNIDVDFYYYKENILVKKVSVKAAEFSSNEFQLGDYIDILDNPKAKGVNLKIRVPLGWEIKDDDSPNIIKQFKNDGNTYLIYIKENITFYSRKQCVELFQKEEFEQKNVESAETALTNPVVSEKSIVTIGSYPSFQFKVEGTLGLSGLKLPVVMKCWVIYYEDRVVYIKSMGLNNSEYDALESLYTMVTNSIVFPDQYK